MDHTYTDLLQSNKKEFLELMEEVLATNILSIGEVHGVKENAYLYYSLFSLFEFDTIALEYPISIKEPILNFLETGVFPIHQLTENITDGRVNKTYLLMLKHLHDEGLLKNFIFFDPEIPRYEHWNDRDEAYANSFFSQYKPEDKTLIVAGSMHTETSPFELDTTLKSEKGTLYPMGYHLLQTLGNFPMCKLIYHSGRYYNFEVRELPTTRMPGHMLRKRQSENMRYEIHFKDVNPVESF